MNSRGLIFLGWDTHTAAIKSVVWHHFKCDPKLKLALRNIQTPFYICAHATQLCHAGKSNYHFKRASEAELAEEISA